MPEVDLAFIARQLERLVNDVAGLKDDMTVVIARLDRLDATTHSLVTEVRAMHSRHERVAKRVERLADADRKVPPEAPRTRVRTSVTVTAASPPRPTSPSATRSPRPSTPSQVGRRAPLGADRRGVK